MKDTRAAICGLVLLALGLAACGSGQKSGASSELQQTAKARLEEQQKLVAQTTQQYKQMDNATLLSKLAEQSKGKQEPFNSLAYRELKGRKDVNTEALVSQINQSKNSDGLLPLLLLRHLNHDAYMKVPAEERAAVLTDALKTSEYFNTWGLPNGYLEDASQAMLESGKSAEPALRRMLSDTRPAPLFGSQEHMQYKRYQYRVCDYALFFLERIQGNDNFRMPVSPAERDSLLKELMK